MALVAALALTVLARLPGWNLPLDRDEGEYATLAQQWIRGGGVPYRDFLEQKPPLAVFVDMAALEILGPGVGSLRTAGLAWMAASAAAVWLLVASLAGAGAGLVAALLFALASSLPAIQGLAFNTEQLTALPMALALFCLVGRERAPGEAGSWKGESPFRGGPDGGARRCGEDARWFLAGLCVGVAGLAKQPALLALAFLPLPGSRTPSQAARRGLAMGLGGLLPWLAVAGLFALWGPGALKGFVFCVFGYNFSYAGQGWTGAAGRALDASRRLAPLLGPLVLAALLGLGASRRPRGGWAGPLAAWLLSAAAGLGLSARFYPHYFLALAAPLACLASLWIAGGPWRGPGAAARLALLSALLAGWAWNSLPYWRAAGGGAKSRMMYGLDRFALAPGAAEAIRAADPRGGRLWIWGSEAELYFLSGLRPASRFLFDYPFTGESPAWPGGGAELLSGLEDARTGVAVLAAPLDPSSPLQAALAGALGRDFRPWTRSGGMLIAVRK